MQKSFSFPVAWLRGILGIGLLIAHTAAFAANDRGLLYRAERDGREIYLLGSVHVADGNLYPLRDAMEKAFTSAQMLAVEIDITRVDTARVATWMAQHGVYPEGDSLRNHLRPETWQRLGNYLQERGIDPQTVERQKPGLLVSSLSIQQLAADGLHADFGIDQHFLAAAGAAKKPIVELETIEEQLELLAAMPDPDASINDMLDEIADIKSLTDDLTALWKTGDADAFERMVLADMAGENPDSQAYIARLLRDRNHSMTERLLSRRGDAKTLLVVVGAAHLVGDEGVPALLKQRGFSVRQL